MINAMLKAKCAENLELSQNIFLEIIYKVLWSFCKKNKIPKRICIYRIGNIGDIICAVPAMIAIRKNFPNAHITLLSSPGNKGMPGAKELLKNAWFIDNMWIYYSHEIISLRQKLNFIKKVRSNKFDLWIELPVNLISLKIALRNIVFAKISGARNAFGFKISTTKLWSKEQSIYRKFPKEVDRLLQILQKQNIYAKEILFDLPISEIDRQKVKLLFKKYNIDGTLPIIAMSPGGKRISNHWPTKRFIKVGQIWIENGANILVLGGNKDHDLAQKIVNAIGSASYNLAGETTLLQSAELLKRCCMLLTNDTGTMHLAAAVGTPCVVIFSARDFPGKWIPWGNNHKVIRKNPNCAVCFIDDCKYNICMSEITIDEVYNATKQVWNECT
jgi:lipopolysaccharide heptosyltransferase II